jgi:hypothetical protein
MPSNRRAVPPPDVQDLVAAPKQRHPWVMLVSMMLVRISAVMLMEIDPADCQAKVNQAAAAVLRARPSVGCDGTTRRGTDHVLATVVAPLGTALGIGARDTD